MLNLSKTERENALNEIRLMASIKHPNIIEYKESFIDEGTQTLCLVMEYADDGDLDKKLVEHRKLKTCFSARQIISINMDVFFWIYYIFWNKHLPSGCERTYV